MSAPSKKLTALILPDCHSGVGEAEAAFWGALRADGVRTYVVGGESTSAEVDWATVPGGTRLLAEAAHGPLAAEALIPRLVEHFLTLGDDVLLVPEQATAANEFLARHTAGSSDVIAVLPAATSGLKEDPQAALNDAAFRLRDSAIDLVREWSAWSLIWAERSPHGQLSTVASWWDRVVGGPRLAVTRSQAAWSRRPLQPRLPLWTPSLPEPGFSGELRSGLRQLLKHLPRGCMTAALETVDDAMSILLQPMAQGELPLLFQAAWLGREDLQKAFPSPTTCDYDAFLEWLCSQGVTELGLARAWIRPLLAPPVVKPFRRPRFRPVSTEVAVVRLKDPAKGVSVAASHLVRQLEEAAVHPVSHEIDLDDIAVDARTAGLVIFGVNGDHLGRVVRRVLVDPAARTAAYWWWETDVLPKGYVRAADAVDDVLAPTPFVYDLLRPVLGRKVRLVPPPVPVFREIRDNRALRRRAQLPEGAVAFLVQADGNSSLWRKNVRGAVEAFLMAAPRADRAVAVLILKVRNLDAWPSEAGWIRQQVTSRPDIDLLEEQLSYDAQLALIDACDVLLSLHRSEGLGLGILEAMAAGKLIIATGYGGNAPFMGVPSSCRVPFELVTTADPSGTYIGESKWAEPDLGIAAEFIRMSMYDRAKVIRLGSETSLTLLKRDDSAGWSRTIRELRR